MGAEERRPRRHHDRDLIRRLSRELVEDGIRVQDSSAGTTEGRHVSRDQLTRDAFGGRLRRARERILVALGDQQAIERRNIRRSFGTPLSGTAQTFLANQDTAVYNRTDVRAVPPSPWYRRRPRKRRR